MGVTFSTKDAKDLGFFETLYAGNVEMLAVVSQLEGLGVVFDVAPYTLFATVSKGSEWKLSLPIGTTTLMKGVASSQSDMALSMIKGFLAKLLVLLGGNSATPPTTVTEKEPVVGYEPELKKPPKKSFKQGLKDAIKAPGGVSLDDSEAVSATGTPAPKIKPEVIGLVDAEAVGQKVHGTSSGSVYVAVALNDRVKLASRLQGSNLSLRVEVKGPTPSEVAAIKASGMAWHGPSGYGSIHMDTQSIPPRRVLGAFIYGMGIKFDRVLPVGEEVPV